MRSLEIRNFKGIDELPGNSLPLERDSKPVNVLVYGENGAGKSSVAEAITLAKYYDRMEKRHVPPRYTGSSRESMIANWLSGYLRDKSKPGFSIKIDGHDLDSSLHRHPIVINGVYVLNRMALNLTHTIRLSELIHDLNFSFHNDRNELMSKDFLSMVIDDVNVKLKDDFKETVEIFRSQTDPDLLVVKDNRTNESCENGVHSRFNEAKLNLIKVLVFLAFVKYDMKKGEDLIILDDIITSLDVGNRLILTDLILRELSDVQIIILTHSFGFFNLVSHHISATNRSEKWNTCSLNQLSDQHVVVKYPVNKEKKQAKSFKSELDAIADISTSDLPNKVRQHLELLLHEFAKVLIIGNHEEAKDIISKLESDPKNLYYCIVNDKEVRTIYDLVRDIKKLSEQKFKPNTVLYNLRRLFNDYDVSNNIGEIAETIKKVDSFQKLVLHPGSHTNSGTVRPITKKEMVITIELIDYLESIVYQPNTTHPNGI